MGYASTDSTQEETTQETDHMNVSLNTNYYHSDELTIEVTGGVDQKTIPGLVELIKKMRNLGVTIITIEHNINIIMEISDSILALDQGKKIAFGSPKEIQNNKKVIDAYLGTVDAA